MLSEGACIVAVGEISVEGKVQPWWAAALRGEAPGTWLRGLPAQTRRVKPQGRAPSKRCQQSHAGSAPEQSEGRSGPPEFHVDRHTALAHPAPERGTQQNAGPRAAHDTGARVGRQAGGRGDDSQHTEVSCLLSTGVKGGEYVLPSSVSPLQILKSGNWYRS